MCKSVKVKIIYRNATWRLMRKIIGASFNYLKINHLALEMDI